jgi:transcription antitermination factor NusB
VKQPRARRIRELAFRALFQLDAGSWQPGDSAESDASLAEGDRSEPPADADLLGVRDALFDEDDGPGASPIAIPTDEAEANEALRTAASVYLLRRVADTELNEAAPSWPAHRRPSADRAILRLGWYELTRAGVAPRIAINEAVELAKRYSTDRSPAFINGVLDTVAKAHAVAAESNDAPAHAADADARNESEEA